MGIRPLQGWDLIWNGGQLFSWLQVKMETGKEGDDIIIWKWQMGVWIEPWNGNDGSSNWQAGTWEPILNHFHRGPIGRSLRASSPVLVNYLLSSWQALLAWLMPITGNGFNPNFSFNAPIWIIIFFLIFLIKNRK